MARLRSVPALPIGVVFFFLSGVLLLSLLSCGGSSSPGGGGGGGNPPATPSGLAVTAGNQQVSLTWNAVTTASSYNLKRGTASGGPYTKVASASLTNYTDSSLTNGTAYYYVVSAVNAYGESGNSVEAAGTPIAPPSAPSGLNATPGNAQVSLAWNAVASGASYNVKRATISGGPYSTVSSLTGTSYTDSSVTNGTTFYYVVSAVNAGGESGNSSQASATPIGSATTISATIDVLANRHAISPYVYGAAFPHDASTISNLSLPMVRWGGNGASTYNWELGTSNAANDYFFEDFGFGALNSPTDSDSTQFITDVKAAGSAPLMTMVMLPWVAQSAETSVHQGGANNYHWTFSASQDNACGATNKVDQYNPDAGVNLKADCATAMVASQAQLNRTYFPLLDDHTQTCTGTCVYRSDWAAALAAAFGSGSCPIPYTPITSCHFYDMDNEIDIWGGTHIDVHPNPTTYEELRNVYVTEAGKLKGWDTAAVRLGPVSCCWYFYWRSATGAGDTSSHGGVDFLPWWLNDVAWSDAVSGSRTLDMFDIHAYPDADTNGLSQAQLRALAAKIYRDWWDPSFNSAAAYIVNGGFSNEPLDGKPFRIPRMRALLNQIYPGTGFAITEWSAEFAGGADFATALGDADAYGILGRERVSLSTRWTAPSSNNPNYQALKLYTKYGFGTTSVAASHNADPSLFSTYAALNSTGTVLTIMVLNKDPGSAAQVTFAANGFNPTGTQTAYTLSQSSPTAITPTAGSWSATQTFAPYTVTLLVVPGTLATPPAAEWDLNPDTTMVPASGTVTLNPTISSGTGNVTLSNAVFDAYEGASACSVGSLNITTAAFSGAGKGAIVVTAGGSPAFCHFTVTGTDSSGVAQTQGGWIVVGKPAATFAKSGDNQSGPTGSPLNLSVTLNPGSSGGTKTGASVLFSVDAGAVLNGTGTKVIAVTNSAGVAAVTLTLPASAQTVTVTAEGPYGLGHPVATFTETAQ